MPACHRNNHSNGRMRITRQGNTLWISRFEIGGECPDGIGYREDRIKPRPLKRGDKIGIIAPAGPVTDWGSLQRGIECLEAEGFSVMVGRNIKPESRVGYLSASDRERLEDIVLMFNDPEIAGIICARGGYGTLRLLNLIPYARIRENPKVFVGYSDITALHLALQSKTGLVTFHGPMVTTDLGRKEDEGLLFNLAHLTRMITGDSIKEICCGEKGRPKIIYGDMPAEGRFGTLPAEIGIKVLNRGRAEGLLRGGNLAMMASLIGTPYMPKLKGCILLLEDTGEPPYRVDRMLCQLYLSGAVDGVKGIIFDRFIPDYSSQGGVGANCRASSESSEYEDIAAEFAARLGIPAIYGIPAGHGIFKLTLPLNTYISMDTDPIRIELPESPFEM